MKSRFSHRLAIALVLVITSPCWAWSYKEHILFTRLAVMHILADPTAPPAMKDALRSMLGDVPDMAAAEDFFLHTKVGDMPSGFYGLSYWCYMPDEHARFDKAIEKVEPFGVHERLLHFIDLELLVSGDAKREYKHDLSNKPKLSDFPRDMKDPRYIQAGMLPFRIEQSYQLLVDCIRAGRMTAQGREAQEGKTAIYWAGYLAHYLADNTQPQHATMDYKSQSYFADQRRSPNVHAEVEYRMCDDAKEEFPELRKGFWALFVKELNEFQDPVQTTDLWQSSVEVSLKSYDALPLIGLASMYAAKQAGTPEHPTGPAQAFDTEAFFRFKGQCFGREMSVMEMKAIQNAWAVERIERIYRRAWDEAATSLPQR